MPHLRYILFLILTLPSLAAPSLHVDISESTFYVGEEFRYEILITGAEKVSADEIEGDDTLAIQFTGQTAVERGGEKGFALTYRMMPLDNGLIILPIISVKADDTYLSTNEEEYITARQAESNPALSLTQTMPDRDLYVGEPFRASWKFRSEIPLTGFRALNFDVPLFYDTAFSITAPHDAISQDDDASIGLPVSNTRLIARYSDATEAGVPAAAISFDKIVVPEKPGEYTLSPATLLTSYIAPPEPKGRNAAQWRSTYPSYFNNNFFEETDGEAFEKFHTASRGNRLVVLPLPTAGQPDDFTGQVGKRTITATASPTVLHAGDPITLTITISGNDFPEITELPELDGIEAFTRQFSIPPRQSSGRIEGTTKTYIRTIRPLGQEASAIPAIRLPYFDPETKAYALASTQPIPITVKPADTITAFDASLTGSGPLRNLVSKNQEGITANITDPAALYSSTTSGYLPLLWLLAALPPIAFLAYLILGAPARLRAKDPAKARSLAAGKTFTKAISHASTLAETEAALRDYLSAKLHLHPTAHTLPEIEFALTAKGASKETLATIREIYTTTESTRFHHTPEQPTPNLRPQAITAVKSLSTILALTLALLPTSSKGEATLLSPNNPSPAASLSTPATNPKSFVPSSLRVSPPSTLALTTPAPDRESSARPTTTANTTTALFDEANATFTAANNTALSDPTAARDLYAASILKYQYLIDQQGVETPALHLNLGNAHFLAGDHGRAVLHYQRALALDPLNADATHNLRYLRTLTIDELPPTRRQQVVHALTFWHRSPFLLRAILFGLANAALWLLLARILLGNNGKKGKRKSITLIKAIAATAALTLILFASLLTDIFRWGNPVDAVVTAREVIARQGDGLIYDNAFSSPLHPGTEFKILQTRNHYHQARLLNGETCWIPVEAVETVAKE
ncbi:MAG: BatD family protein [Akkermansiaceae bacterium]|nr:BatD family protein [Akkermansiaceae bacterium]MDP4896386.1 BatD family protein [Akkermansiaceae bacterium]MDP4995701.1 BatD family protein [Akkermansiaceae bacterium]